MNAEQIKNCREIWIPALLSGEYSQGRNTLKTADGCFCCLGVATDISEGIKWEEAKYNFLAWDTQSYSQVIGSCTTPPYRIVNDFGLQGGGFILPDGGYLSLIKMNDESRNSFEEIAFAIADVCDQWEAFNEFGTN